MHEINKRIKKVTEKVLDSGFAGTLIGTATGIGLTTEGLLLRLKLGIPVGRPDIPIIAAGSALFIGGGAALGATLDLIRLSNRNR